MTSFFTAAVLLQLAVQAPPPASSSNPLLEKTTELVRQGHLTAAEAAAKGYVQIYPVSSDGHFMLGYILFLEKKPNESLVEYTEGAKHGIPAAHDLKVVASDYVLLSDFTDADRWFTKVTEWTPGDVQAWYDLGRTKYNENRFDEAISAFNKTLQLDPANMKAQDNLGLCYAALGRNEQAIGAYKRAIEMEEKSLQASPEPYLDFGSLLIDTDNVPDALPLLAKSLAIAPDDYRVHRELGKAYLHLNDLNKARAELEKAIQLAPRNAPLHFMLAQVYRKQGLPDKAKHEADSYSALKQAPAE